MTRSHEVSYSQPDLKVQVTDTQPRSQEDYNRAFAQIVEQLGTLDISEMLADTPETSSENDPVLNKISENVEDAAVSDEQFQEMLLTAAPENQSHPQTSWPESDSTNIPTEEQYSQRLDFRLSILGYILDGVRPYLNEGDVATWLEFKRAIAETKTITDMGDKVWTVIPLETAVHDFKNRFNAIEADYQAVMNL